MAIQNVLVTGRTPFPLEALCGGRVRDHGDLDTIIRSHKLPAGAFHGLVEFVTLERQAMAVLTDRGWKRHATDAPTLREIHRARQIENGELEEAQA